VWCLVKIPSVSRRLIYVGGIVPSAISESSAASRSRNDTQSIVSPLWRFLPLCRAAILMALAVTGCVRLSAQQASLASPTPAADSLPDAPSPQKASQTTQEAQDPLHPQASDKSRGTSPSSTATNVSENAPEGADSAANQSNNPITLKTQLILQNFLAPTPQGDRGRSADEELIRLYLPFKVFGVDNILRIYQPINTDPLFPNGREAGLGDTTIYDLARDCIKVGGGTLLVVVEEVVVGTSAATRGRAFRADCRGRRNEPGGEGGRPLLTSASAGVFPSSG
jgi:hypothetical protein